MTDAEILALYTQTAQLSHKGHILAFAGALIAATRRDAIEECAKACEEYSSAKWKEYKRGHGPNRANPETQGNSNGATDCALAIRALAPDTERGEE